MQGFTRTFLCGFIGLAAGAIAHAENVIFTDFSDTTGLTINGHAATATTSDGVVMRVAPSAGNRGGSFFSTDQVDTTDFSASFSFRIHNNGGSVFDGNTENGADGLVFVVQPQGNNVGGIGAGIGYSGIRDSLGIEFDTWHNSSNNDPSQSHVAIDLNGNVRHAADGTDTYNVAGPELDDDVRWYAWVDYKDNLLEVRLSEANAYPTDPILTKTLDLAAVIGQQTAFVGFTSGTGAAWSDHDVIDFRFTRFVPEPASAAILGLGTLLMSRRRRV